MISVARRPRGEAAILARAGAIVPMLAAGVESFVSTDAVPALDARRFEREVIVWLGAEGTARDGEGGRYALKSSGRPSGAAASVEGAERHGELSAGGAWCSMPLRMPPPPSLTRPAARHEDLTTREMSSSMKLRFDVRW